MPQMSRRQNATEFRNAQLSVVSCKPLLDGGLSPFGEAANIDPGRRRLQVARTSYLLAKPPA
jgi:hypothetical protein